MIKMKNIVKAVGKSNWAIFLKGSNYMEDVSGPTANTTQLLPHKKTACDSREVLKMWSNSVPREMVLSCLFCMTLLKLVKTTVGNFLSQKCVLHITTSEVKQGTRGWYSSKGTTCCQPGFWHTTHSHKTSGSYYWFVLTALEVQALSVSLIFHIINYLEREHGVQTRLVMEKTVWLNMRSQCRT